MPDLTPTITEIVAGFSIGSLAQNDGGYWPADTETACRLRIDGTRGDDGWPMQRVGKARAGRRLDGIEHNVFPEG